MSHNLHVPKWAETSPMPVEGNSRALAAFRSVGILFAFERFRPARILFSQRRQIVLERLYRLLAISPFQSRIYIQL